jgi:hypothetical protein
VLGFRRKEEGDERRTRTTVNITGETRRGEKEKMASQYKQSTTIGPPFL